MKSRTKGQFILKGIVFGLLAGVVFTVAVLLLWNWLMPAIFGLGVITFWQALGLLVLAKILFGGGHGPHRSWHENEKARMHKAQFGERFKHAHMMYHQKDQDDDSNE